jgi:hypothetical protein
VAHIIQCIYSAGWLVIVITGTNCSVCSQLHTFFCQFNEENCEGKKINHSSSTLKTTKQNQTTVHFQLNLKNNMHMLVHKTHCMTLCSMNTELPCSHRNNINHHRIPQMTPEELQNFIPAVSFTIYHPAVLVWAHIWLSQIHHSLNTGRKRF